MTTEINSPEKEISAPPKQKTPIGPTIGILIILVILLIGGFYYLSAKLQKERLPSDMSTGTDQTQ